MTSWPEQETALYDRWIRNIVLFLEEWGSLILNDYNSVTEAALAAIFLIPFAEICCDSLKDFNHMANVSVEIYYSAGKASLSQFRYSNGSGPVLNDGMPGVGQSQPITAVDSRPTDKNFQSRGEGSRLLEGKLLSLPLGMMKLILGRKSLNEKCCKLSKQVVVYTVDCREKVSETDQSQLQYPSFRYDLINYNSKYGSVRIKMII
ncbi:hypothetical protein E3N88_39474 [Mikania micrantha]|uniref:Uncharacterized protein n=1 Tax=Mikania micrantha TaxID=192012 RepID=A0A5N6LX31_9ASTR|nr:hypothetical protein E3N88_39474 [Mikania micrantha]